MYREQIDRKLIELRKRLKENTDEYEDLQSEIEDLNYRSDELEKEYEVIEKEIEELEKQLVDAMTMDIDNTLTGDEFRDAFIKCSYFCEKYDEIRKIFQCVIIGENTLQAVDGYRAIEIKCSNIPEKLQNTLIKWDTRDNFENSIEKELTKPSFFDIDKIIKDGKSDMKLKCSLNELKEKYFVEIRNSKNGETLVLQHGDKEIGFNKKYYDILSMVFESQDAIIYYPRNPVSTLVIESEKQSAILMPIRLEKCY